MSSHSTSEYCEDKLWTINIRNLPVGPHRKPKIIEDALDYKPENDDIILCSYPKTGTTWMHYIVWKILHKNETLPSLQEMTYKHIPFIEITGIESARLLHPPRVYKHHFPYSHMKINENAKYIYIYRNPMDTLVSCYYFASRVRQYEFEFDWFFERFLSGNVSYGGYFDHVLEFYHHRHDSHLLLISYEDLHRAKKEQILKIANFLGKIYYQELVDNKDLLEEILTVTEFNHMKQHINSHLIFQNGDQSSKRDSCMFRKGIIGDGKNLMKPEQIRKLEIKMLEKMKNTEILSQWTS